ncbi:phosphoribosylaminoimidazolecarboxamide formyltransferase / IMP cyclohydrolase [Cnuella takakiae]|uniref:Bifunctional purine biosynthesis protein PurH n=2 Tax=Cnuella takakiae TaxID=1302690 RepID=A0A1M5D130_9BACT|nr:phosphoribosylaminoimidazolecarboxamide formyltransferase / IMP cyclohydrolase [Cnuella takakiae]
MVDAYLCGSRPQGLSFRLPNNPFMNKKINAALISVFYKDGLEPVVRQLEAQGATIYSTGGTQQFIEGLGIKVVPVENLTTYPSILGGRVKTLHPTVFGGILGRRAVDTDRQEMQQYGIPEIDLVIVDLYPFQETVANTTEEKAIIEKIDIGGPSMIRGAAKNFSDVTVVASKDDYSKLVDILAAQNGETSLEQRRAFAAKAFQIVADYDIAINNYFNPESPINVLGAGKQTVLRYGENPHQTAIFYGNLEETFAQLHGKELSYNNLVDVDAAIELIKEFNGADAAVFGIIKHTNVCGIATRSTVAEAWTDALAGDPESAFGGVLVTNKEVDAATANAISEIFFEVLIAPSFSEEAMQVLQAKKNRILLQLKNTNTTANIFKNAVNGTLQQGKDAGNFEKWEEVGGRPSSDAERKDLEFANIVCKHLKSNAIALVKNGQLVGKGCGQTSRIDALRHAVEKAKQFNFDLNGAVMASDAFFPFNDCVQLGHEAGITAFVQPGGSIRDKDSIAYCQERGLALVMTGMRHFRH